MLEGPRERKPTLEELHAKYGKNWGIGAEDKPAGFQAGQAPSWKTVIKAYHDDPSQLSRLTGPLMTRNQKQPFVVNTPTVAAPAVSDVKSEDESVSISPALPTKRAA
jgi:hypothetical protein